MRPQSPEFQRLIARLVETLREELRQNQRLLEVVRRKKEALASPRRESVEGLLRVEREVITNAVMMERDRIALVTELGEILGRSDPSRLRLAEVLLYASSEDRDEILDLRDDFRDIADELDDLASSGCAFTRHRKENVRLYVTPSRSRSLIRDTQGRARTGAGVRPGDAV
ncbi:MAG: flagellar export chaperone FlgN [Planctomycetes bacterium]|nr:flagellar export chaperone FlgN [Planctomycetota bacterium]